MGSLAEKFGMEVRKQREELRLSQEKFAEKAGIHRTYVSSIELGKVDPSLRIAGDVARALGLRLSELIARAERAPR